MRYTTSLLVALASTVAAQNTATSAAAVAKAAATALTLSPTSHVKGAAFDRIAIIYLENTDYSIAASDRECPVSQRPDDTTDVPTSKSSCASKERHPALELFVRHLRSS